MLLIKNCKEKNMLRTTECIQHISSFGAEGGGGERIHWVRITDWRVRSLGSVPGSVHGLCLRLPSLNSECSESASDTEDTACDLAYA